MKALLPVCLLFMSVQSSSQRQGKLAPDKLTAINYIDNKQKDLIAWAGQIWEYAEPSLKETRSSQLLIDILRAEGFTVKQNLCGIPTLFMASYGSAKPVIGLFGEYDADANASNNVVPRREELIAGGYGHGGHHNLLGTGSLGAALAIKELIRTHKLNCTIRYYGTTAEGSMGAKTYLARDGYFNDLDLSLYWHPAPATWASTRSWDALIDFDILFSSSKVNMTRSNANDSTTLGAVELFLAEMQLLRREITAGKKINYSVRQWKDDLDYIPDTIRISVRIQCARQADALSFFEKTRSALANSTARTGVAHTVHVTRAMHQFLPNVTAMKIVQQNMELLGPLVYTTAEQDFTRELQRAMNLSPEGVQDRIAPFLDQSGVEQLYGYASDIGDASWIAPEIYFVVRTLPRVNMHHWQGTIFSNHSIGHKGMLQAAKILSMTIIDFVENKSLQQAIRKEFEENRKTYRYRSLL